MFNESITSLSSSLSPVVVVVALGEVTVSFVSFFSCCCCCWLSLNALGGLPGRMIFRFAFCFDVVVFFLALAANIFSIFVFKLLLASSSVFATAIFDVVVPFVACTDGEACFFCAVVAVEPVIIKLFCVLVGSGNGSFSTLTKEGVVFCEVNRATSSALFSSNHEWALFKWSELCFFL